MLTLERFRALAESYGGTIARWPEATRADADALLQESAEACAALEEARRLDGMLVAIRVAHDGTVFPRAAQDAALRRLRLGVAARIAVPEAEGRDAARMENPLLVWLRRAVQLEHSSARMATACACCVAAGVLLGAMYSPGVDTVLTMLQPEPIYAQED